MISFYCCPFAMHQTVRKYSSNVLRSASVMFEVHVAVDQSSHRGLPLFSTHIQDLSSCDVHVDSYPVIPESTY